jgi:hypothetical protein
MRDLMRVTPVVNNRRQFMDAEIIGKVCFPGRLRFSRSLLYESLLYGPLLYGPILYGHPQQSLNSIQMPPLAMGVLITPPDYSSLITLSKTTLYSRKFPVM